MFRDDTSVARIAGEFVPFSRVGVVVVKLDEFLFQRSRKAAVREAGLTKRVTSHVRSDSSVAMKTVRNVRAAIPSSQTWLWLKAGGRIIPLAAPLQELTR